MPPSHPPEPALFSLPARLGLSLLAVIFFAIVAAEVHGFSESDDSLIPTFLGDLINSVGGEIFFPSALFAIGVFCFICLRRHPLGVARVLWILAAFDFLVLLFGVKCILEPRELEDLAGLPFWPPNGLYLPSLGVRLLPAWWYSLPLLSLIFLAGELTHAAHLRLMRAELDEAINFDPADYDRVLRRQRLILTVRGSNPPLYVILSRLMVLLVIPIPFGFKLFTLSLDVRFTAPESEIRAPQVVASKTFLNPVDWPRVTIDSTGQILFGGEVVASDDNSDCPQLTSSLMRLHEATVNPMGIAIVIHSDVKFQRIIEALEAIKRARPHQIIFLDAPLP